MAEKVIAFIPVRGGSKSIPLKNIKSMAGKPLAFWTVEAALKCSLIDKVFLCTDSEEISLAMERFNSSDRFEIVTRSSETATDTASTESAMLEFAEKNVFDTMVLIQATSPLLGPDDLTRGIDKYRTPEIDSVLSVVRQKRFIWDEPKDGSAFPVNYDFKKRPRRQEFCGYLVENGAFYIMDRKDLIKSKCRLSGRVGLCEMDESTYIELDEPSDWLAIEKILEDRRRFQTDQFLSVKIFITDVDGVLTDSGMYYSENGDENKKFNTRDGMGFYLLRQVGIKTAIVTAEDTKIVERRAKKLKVDHLHQGIMDKVACVKELIGSIGLSMENVCYIGDDINDEPLLAIAGFSCCPADAQPEVKAVCSYITKADGGRGCVREVIDLILNNQPEKS